MNLRDKLRTGGDAEPEAGAGDPFDADDFFGAPAPAPEKAAPKGKSPKGAKAGKKGKAAKGREPLLKFDFNRRMLLLAGLAAGVTSLLAVSYLSSAGQGLADAGEKVKVLVPAEDLKAGVRLTEDRLTTAEFPKAFLAKGYFTDPEKLKDRLAIAPMVAGEPILEIRTSMPNPKYGIAYLLAPGERAKTITVDSASGLAGLVKPGNEVDLLATIPDPNNTARRIGTPALQKARVIAVGDELLGMVKSEDDSASNNGGGISSASTITLAVPGTKIGLVSLLEDLGNLKMVLRAAGDDSVVKSPFTDAQIMSLVGGSVPSKPAPVAPKPAAPVYREPAPRPVAPRPVYREPAPRPVEPRPVAPKPVPAAPKEPEVIKFGG